MSTHKETEDTVDTDKKTSVSGSLMPPITHTHFLMYSPLPQFCLSVPNVYICVC